MSKLDRRFNEIVLKWSITIFVIFILWMAKIFHVAFLLVLLLIQEINKGLVWMGEGTQLGLKDYWAAYWTYWLMAYISSTLLLLLWYYTYYRRKRPHLIIGGHKEGRVLWIKGIRRGLAYDLWDAKNYITLKIKKNNLRPIPLHISVIPNGEIEKNRRWPDPLSIPLGRPTSKTIIYFSRPWRLKIERLIIPRHIQIKLTFFSIQIEQDYLMNVSDPLIPGRVMLQMGLPKPGFKEYDAEAPQTGLVDHLEITRTLVQASVAANPEVNIIDYEDGSYAMVEGGPDD
jgi:hypothetical protein